MKRRVARAALAALALAAAGFLRPADGQDPAPAGQLVFLDVGQGEAILVRSPEGKVALVDAGPRGVDLVGQLRRHGVDTIDIAIATHPHADHIGGMGSVLRNFPVRYYMDNGRPHTTATYRDLMDQLVRAPVTYLQPRARQIGMGSVRLTVLPPPAEPALNNTSIGLIVELGAFRALLTGDSEVEQLEYLLERGVPEVQVLKAAHHGSDDAVTADWLAATRPEVVVISVGRENPYGSPKPRALQLYAMAGAAIYRTDRHGAVTVNMNPDGSYEVMTAHGY